MLKSLLVRLSRHNQGRFPILNSVAIPVSRLVAVWNGDLEQLSQTYAAESSRTGTSEWSTARGQPIFQAIQARVNHDTPWPRNQELLSAKTGGTKTGLVGTILSNATLNRLDQLIAQARQGSLQWDEVERDLGRIHIGVDKNGTPYLVTGMIPLSLAMSIGRDNVPADVVLRHPDWQAFRDELIAFAKLSLDDEVRIREDLSHYGGRLYQQAYHFDTEDVPYVYGRERFESVFKCVSPGMKTVLDIGANFGLLCSEFEKQGFACTAVELKPQDFHFLQKLKDYTGGNFTTANCSIFDFRRPDVLEYDVVLALFIFHHFIKTPELHDELITLLERIKCRELYLGVPDTNEEQMSTAYLNLSANDFARLIMKHTGLTEFEKIDCPGLGNRAILKIH